MADDPIVIRGLRPLLREFKKIDVDLPNEVKEINKDAAEPVARTARSLAPNRSGDLAGSIRAGATRRSGVVRVGKASVPYAGPIHFGWPRRNIGAQPFLWDALDRHRSDIETRYVEQLGDLVDRVFPGGTGGE